MVAAADDLYGNMTKKLREKQMYLLRLIVVEMPNSSSLCRHSPVVYTNVKRTRYERTLIIVSADNGGPASIYASSHAANNWPLRGGKKTYHGSLVF